MENINWRTEDRVCIHLNTPQENPRWKRVAETYGFSTSEIDKFERAVESNSQQFPHDNFDKILEFLSNEL